jgi:hypothetical protein
LKRQAASESLCEEISQKSPEAHPLSRRFRCEEWFGNAIDDLRGHAGALILNKEADLFSCGLGLQDDRFP